MLRILCVRSEISEIYDDDKQSGGLAQLGERLNGIRKKVILTFIRNGLI